MCWYSSYLLTAAVEIFAPHALRFEGTAPRVKYSIYVCMCTYVCMVEIAWLASREPLTSFFYLQPPQTVRNIQKNKYMYT